MVKPKPHARSRQSLAEVYVNAITAACEAGRDDLLDRLLKEPADAMRTTEAYAVRIVP
jgi:hypothetical protein